MKSFAWFLLSWLLSFTPYLFIISILAFSISILFCENKVKMYEICLILAMLIFSATSSVLTFWLELFWLATGSCFTKSSSMSCVKISLLLVADNTASTNARFLAIFNIRIRPHITWPCFHFHPHNYLKTFGLLFFCFLLITIF